MKESTLKNLLIFFYSIGLLGLIFPLTAPYFKILIPFTLLLNLVLDLIFQKKWNLEIFLAMFFILIAGFGIEWLGVKTKAIFGAYSYGTILGPKLGNTPLIIGINWLLLVFGSFYITASLNIPYVMRAFSGAALMVGYDWVLEPVAVKLGMWYWHAGHIPLQNYIAWFAIALVFHLIYGKYAKGTRNTIAGFIFIVQLLFFLILRVSMQVNLW